VNGCRFCATSHFFGRTYSPFYATGEALYRQACAINQKLGCNEFFVMDENFLKDRERAMGLLAAMERDGRAFTFGVFSSTEAIEAFGVDNMVRLGVFFVWLGAESRTETYEKNRGRDLKGLIKKLRDHGIAVLVSGILLLEHHRPENIWEDIDFICGLEADLTQFMLFTAMPGTQLYEQVARQGLLSRELPFEEWHGQKYQNWRHPHFAPGDAPRLVDEAFRAEFDRNSSSIYRMADTALRGWRTLEDGPADPWLAKRKAQLKARAAEMRIVVPCMRRFAHDDLERKRVEALRDRYVRELGPLTLRERGLAAAARVLSEAHALRVRLGGGTTQPKPTVTRYRQGAVKEDQSGRVPAVAPSEGRAAVRLIPPPHDAACRVPEKPADPAELRAP